MKNHRFFIFFVVILIALTLAACERSASTPPPMEGTAFPTLEGTQDPMGELGAFATQTAAAQMPGGESTEVEPQPEGETSTEGQPDDENQPEEVQSTPVPAKEYPVPEKYTLQKGEFPYCIARRFNISPGSLLAANGLTSSSVTYVGQTLTIPNNAGSFDAGSRSLIAHPAVYTVRAGDTVYSIACLFGDVDPRAIEDANGLSGAYTLPVGDTLQIP